MGASVIAACDNGWHVIRHIIHAALVIHNRLSGYLSCALCTDNNCLLVLIHSMPDPVQHNCCNKSVVITCVVVIISVATN